VWLMQPEAQTTTRGFLAVSTGALRDSDRYSRRLRSVITLAFLHLRRYVLNGAIFTDPRRYVMHACFSLNTSFLLSDRIWEYVILCKII